MIFWVLQRIIISIVLILCAHYIFIFLKTNLTVPKTRDLVNQPREKYKEIYEKINKDNKKTTSDADNGKMKDELKNYLKDLKKNADNSTSSSNIGNTNSSTFDSNNINSFNDAGNMNSVNYSSY
tara:strand:+ start:7597 stop:7968 length:372 start_codon:yes stop_codon:yes gene_type:complete